MNIDLVPVVLAGVGVGGLLAIALGLSYFRDYNRNPQMRSGEMAWARAIRLSWILLLLSTCALADAILNSAYIPEAKPWQRPVAIVCVIDFAAIVLLILAIMIVAYTRAGAQPRLKR